MPKNRFDEDLESLPIWESKPTQLDLNEVLEQFYFTENNGDSPTTSQKCVTGTKNS